MAKTDKPVQPVEKPERVFFAIPRVQVGINKVLVNEAHGDTPAEYEERPVYTSQDEAVAAAQVKATDMGYGKISLQNQTETEWQFLAYEPERK